MNNAIKRKIVVLSNVEEGIYCFRLELIQRLLSEDFDVVLVAPPGPYTQEFEEMGVRRVFVKLNRQGMNPVEDFGLLLKYISILRKEKANAVLTYTIKPNLYGGLACRIMGVPYLANITGCGRIFQKQGIVRTLVEEMLTVALKRARMVFFQNKENMSTFMNAKLTGDSPVTLLPGSGVNLNYFQLQAYPAEEENIRFLMIARLCRDKGIFEFIKAAEAVRQKYSNVEFHVAGWNEDPQYQQQAQRLIAEGYFYDHGVLSRQEIPDLICKCHAVVLPSYHEGMANVLLEASASGRPVLASDIAGCREIVDDGRTGFVFPPKNAAALAEKMCEFIELSHISRKEFGLNARRKVEEEFDRQHIVNKYLSVLGEI